VAFASGFASLRRFNALFRRHYGMAPSRLRLARNSVQPFDRIRLTLSYRPPFAWSEILRFLAARATVGVEAVSGQQYRRTVAIGKSRGWLGVQPAPIGQALIVELPTSLSRELPSVLAAVRQIFDLSARSDVIDAHLSRAPDLRGLIRKAPGLRVPGAFDGFDLAVRAILGQQVSVAAASTLSGRLAARFGESIETPFPELNRITPSAGELATTDLHDLTALGMIKSRAECIRSLARAVAERTICLDPGADGEAATKRLLEIPGIGDWTANYIALRALRWPDAFPAGDLALLRQAGIRSPAALRAAADAWRPWRGYAAMYLWNSIAEPVSRSQCDGDNLLPSVSQSARPAAAHVGRQGTHGALSAGSQAGTNAARRLRRARTR
jgi:AraC family transcriptional regulator, regulatory protein of adaptative response / DNA-3-methyladenine glycosylase II